MGPRAEDPLGVEAGTCDPAPQLVATVSHRPSAMDDGHGAMSHRSMGGDHRNYRPSHAGLLLPVSTILALFLREQLSISLRQGRMLF